MEGEAPARRPVAVGWKGEEFLEVRSGLRAGERVVLGEVTDQTADRTRIRERTQ